MTVQHKSESKLDNNQPTVGLLSIPRYWNFGTQLQLAGLQEAICREGYRCQVIDYDYEHTSPSLPLWRRLTRIVRSPNTAIAGLTRRRYERLVRRRSAGRPERFQAFQDDNINLVPPRCRSDEDLSLRASAYDAVVVGSDQLWNPNGHRDERAFFLEFVRPGARIAYAPSIGVASVQGADQEWLASGVEGIDHLSVRERTGAGLIERLTGRHAEVVVDPTALLTPVDWSSRAREWPAPKDFVLQYVLSGDRYIREWTSGIAKELGCQTVVVPHHPVDVLSSERGPERAYGIGPAEFLFLVANARFVVTDSFHGTLFSVLFERQFLSFRRYADGGEAATFSRIEDFLAELSLSDRIAGRERPVGVPTEVEWDIPQAKLSEWTEKSRRFLGQALRSATAAT